jgi:hypothetical protein
MLTIADLLAAGGPLAGLEVLSGAAGLDRKVTWAVSLRPYAPVIPPMNGGEVALVRADFLAACEPRVTIADVVEQLAALRASGLVVHGEVAGQAIHAAERLSLPLMHLPSDAPVHAVRDIEQDIIRECALFQARQQMLGNEEPGPWIERLLAGQISTFVEVQTAARRDGYTLDIRYAVALVVLQRKRACEPGEIEVANNGVSWSGGEAQGGLERICALLAGRRSEGESQIIPHLFGDGVVALVPPGAEGDLVAALRGYNVACGVGNERPLLEASLSLNEARLALLSSTVLHCGSPVRYADLGVERVVLLLYQHSRVELESFVQQVLGPLLEHDATASRPLLPTMSLVAQHGWRLGDAAADKRLHKNTLAYHIDRATTILGIDLKQPESRLALQMALLVLPLVREQNCNRS